MDRIDLAYRGEPEERLAQPYLGGVGEAMLAKLFRQPYTSEMAYFASNPQVAGMMTPDQRITAPTDTRMGRDSVMKNEAIRLLLQNYKPRSSVSDEQRNRFKGTSYASDPENLLRSILARGATGDPSAKMTFEQDAELRSLMNLFR